MNLIDALESFNCINNYAIQFARVSQPQEPRNTLQNNENLVTWEPVLLLGKPRQIRI